jgi:hypothetical protein
MHRECLRNSGFETETFWQDIDHFPRIEIFQKKTPEIGVIAEVPIGRNFEKITGNRREKIFPSFFGWTTHPSCGQNIARVGLEIIIISTVSVVAAVFFLSQTAEKTETLCGGCRPSVSRLDQLLFAVINGKLVKITPSTLPHPFDWMIHHRFPSKQTPDNYCRLAFQRF